MGVGGGGETDLRAWPTVKIFFFFELLAFLFLLLGLGQVRDLAMGCLFVSFFFSEFPILVEEALSRDFLAGPCLRKEAPGNKSPIERSKPFRDVRFPGLFFGLHETLSLLLS